MGIADLNLLREVETVPDNLLDGFQYALSIAIKLPASVFEKIIDAPTPLYAQVYNNANLLLDQSALKLSSHLEGKGYSVLPIPASLPLDMERFNSNLSSKTVANAAGLGWQGKSLLIVTPEHGPRVSFATVLTDMPLSPDQPIKNQCGPCGECSQACPAGAIRNVNTDFHYTSREEALDFQKCADKLLKGFMLLPRVEKPICGFCIKVCPWGRKKQKGKTRFT